MLACTEDGSDVCHRRAGGLHSGDLFDVVGAEGLLGHLVRGRRSRCVDGDRGAARSELARPPPRRRHTPGELLRFCTENAVDVAVLSVTNLASAELAEETGGELRAAGIRSVVRGPGRTLDELLVAVRTAEPSRRPAGVRAVRGPRPSGRRPRSS